MTFLYRRGGLIHAEMAVSFGDTLDEHSGDRAAIMKYAGRLWRSAFVQQVAEVIVSMWRELLICVAALVSVLMLIIERHGGV